MQDVIRLTDLNNAPKLDLERMEASMGKDDKSNREEKITAIRSFYDALNANDTEAAMKLFHWQIERIEFAGLPSAGSFRGLSEMKAHLAQGRSTWAEGGCSPLEIVSRGDRFLAHVLVKVRLKEASEWLEGHVFDGFTFQEGKIDHFQTFAERPLALDWAGLKSTDFDTLT